MVKFFVASCIVGCLAAWIICFARKFEVRGGGSIVEWVQAHAPAKVGEMTRCDFCFSWWVSWVVVVVALVVTGEWWLLGVPFCSTMIARFLLGW